VRRRKVSLEERMAWDTHAAAATVALGFTSGSRNDVEEDPVSAAEHADAMLRERRKRFGRIRRKIARRKPSVH
jgi:hypothetical protein